MSSESEKHKLVVFTKDRRKPRDKDKEIADDKRNPSNHFNAGISTKLVDQILEQLRFDLTKSLDYYKDKDRKRLLILTSAFSFMAIMFSISLGVTNITQHSNANKVPVIEKQYTAYFVEVSTEQGVTKGDESTAFFQEKHILGLNLTKLIGVIIVLGIGSVIIKIILSLKEECVISIAQANCVRQSIHRLIYFKIHGYAPSDCNFNVGDAEKERIENTVFHEIYGKHKKFKTDNNELRDRYSKRSIIYKSSDLASVIIIAIMACSFALMIGKVDTFRDLMASPDSILICTLIVIFFCLIGRAILKSINAINNTLKVSKSSSELVIVKASP